MNKLTHPTQFASRALALTSTSTKQGVIESAHLIESQRINVVAPIRHVTLDEHGHRSTSDDRFTFFDVAVLVRPGINPVDAVMQLTGLLESAIERLGALTLDEDVAAFWADDGLDVPRACLDAETIEDWQARDQVRALEAIELGARLLKRVTMPTPRTTRAMPVTTTPSREQGTHCLDDGGEKCHQAHF